MENKVLTRSFTLFEMIRSSCAERNNYTEQYEPPQEVIDNLTDLCVHILQPVRDELGKPINVSSGYRCPRVNKKEGGSSTSDHPFGRAGDTEYTENGQNFNIKIAKVIIQKKLPFDQIIIEFGPSISKCAWVHVSYNKNRLRGDILRAEKVAVPGKFDKNGDQVYETKYTHLKPEDVLNA